MNENAIRVEVEVDVDMVELGKWPRLTRAAFLAGIAEVLSAGNPGPRSCVAETGT